MYVCVCVCVCKQKGHLVSKKTAKGKNNRYKYLELHLFNNKIKRCILSCPRRLST